MVIESLVMQSIVPSTMDTADLVQPYTVQVNKTLVNSAQSNAGCVMTRAQTVCQEKSRKPLRVPKVIDARVSREHFRNAQHNDPSLARLIDKADVVSRNMPGMC